MRVVSAAIATLFMTTVSAKHIRKALGKNKVLDKKKLMRDAVRVNKQGQPLRKLDEEDEEFEITGAYSIQFDSCKSLKTNDEDIFDEDLYDYTYQGSIVAQKSYVIFNVCKTNYCGYDGSDLQYMVDLGTYMGALAEYLPQKKEAFCEACDEFEDYCNPEDEEADEEEDEEEGEEEDDKDEDEGEEEEDGEDRKLAKQSRRKLTKNFVPPKKSRKLANYIDCDECINQGCYEEEEEDGDNDYDIDDDDVLEWIQNMAECQETEAAYGDYDLYAGFMCNSDGDGVEIALFMDEDCSMYTTLASYANVMDEDDAPYYYNSETLVTYPFKYAIDCADEVEYDDPDEEGDEADDEEENEEEEDAEANEFCQNLLEENALDLDTCGGEDGDDAEEDDAEEDENAANYAWYEYDIDAEQAEEVEYVCKFLQSYEGENAVYDEDSSGNYYDYNTYDEDEEASASSSGSGVSPGVKVVGIVILVLALVAAAFFACRSLGKRKKKDQKAEPLTRKKGGAMA